MTASRFRVVSESVRALNQAVLRRPVRLCVVVLLLVAGGIIDAVVSLWQIPLGTLVLGLGVNSALVSSWCAEVKA